MDLNILIKIIGILSVTICCIIATYTDVKYGIIPNIITIPAIILGLAIVTLYYILNNYMNYFYFISILVVFVFNYLLWHLGLWAGGDVKLFTAISAMLIPEFLDVFYDCNLSFLGTFFNFSNYSIPTLYLMLNSVFAIIPIIIIYSSYIIIKKKSYLIKKLYSFNDLKRVFLYLNLTVLSYLIISLLNVDIIILKLLFSISFIIISSRIINEKQFIILLLSLCMIIYEIITNNISSYIMEFLIFNMLVIFSNSINHDVISKILSENMEIENLKEGMVLANFLCRDDNEYYFDNDMKNKLRYLSNQDTDIIIFNNISGLTKKDILILNKLKKENKIDHVSIKKTLPFAPFILGGLIITFVFGNLLDIIINFMVISWI